MTHDVLIIFLATCDLCQSADMNTHDHHVDMYPLRVSVKIFCEYLCICAFVTTISGHVISLADH